MTTSVRCRVGMSAIIRYGVGVVSCATTVLKL